MTKVHGVCVRRREAVTPRSGRHSCLRRAGGLDSGGGIISTASLSDGAPAGPAAGGSAPPSSGASAERPVERRAGLDAFRLDALLRCSCIGEWGRATLPRFFHSRELPMSTPASSESSAPGRRSDAQSSRSLSSPSCSFRRVECRRGPVREGVVGEGGVGGAGPPVAALSRGKRARGKCRTRGSGDGQFSPWAHAPASETAPASSSRAPSRTCLVGRCQHRAYAATMRAPKRGGRHSCPRGGVRRARAGGCRPWASRRARHSSWAARPRRAARRPAARSQLAWRLAPARRETPSLAPARASRWTGWGCRWAAGPATAALPTRCAASVAQAAAMGRATRGALPTARPPRPAGASRPTTSAWTLATRRANERAEDRPAGVALHLGPWATRARRP